MSNKRNIIDQITNNSKNKLKVYTLMYQQLSITIKLLTTNNGDGMKEIRRRLGIAMKKLKTMKKLWKGTKEATKLIFFEISHFPYCNIWFRDMVHQQASRTKDQCFPNEKF